MESPLLNDVYEEFIQSGKDTRYKPEAYGFILASLDFQRAESATEEHIKANILVSAVVKLSKIKFGPLAYEVLNNWGIKSSDDIGSIVYNLIDMKVLSKSEDDTISEFFSLKEFDDIYLNRREIYTIDKKKIKKFKDS